MARILKEGDAAPDFKLAASAGGVQTLKHYRGNKVVLYFYPKDNTPGCTTEACEFGTQNKKFEKIGALLLGISPDSVESHLKFIKKFQLPFTLLADEGHKVAEAYGVWVEKFMYGRKFMGVQRSTFLIDAKGKILKIWPKVKVKGHAAEVLAAIKNL